MDAKIGPLDTVKDAAAAAAAAAALRQQKQEEIEGERLRDNFFRPKDTALVSDRPADDFFQQLKLLRKFKG